MPQSNAAAEIIQSHEGMRARLAEATCAAFHLVFDPNSDDADAQAKEVWTFIENNALPHMNYEEEVLFKRATSRGVPRECTDLLRDEHDTLRQIAVHLAQDTPRAERAILLVQFIQLFEKHSAREEAVLSLFADHAPAHH